MHLPPDAHPGTHPARARGVRAACRRPCLASYLLHTPCTTMSTRGPVEALHLVERVRRHTRKGEPSHATPTRDSVLTHFALSHVLILP